MQLTIMTWNLHDFRGVADTRGTERQRRDIQTQFLGDQRPAVAAVQEVRGGPIGASHAIADLAIHTGLHCALPGQHRGAQVAALAMADTDFNTGLLWDTAQVHIAADSFEAYGRARNNFWHALALAVFRPVDKTQPFQAGSFHGDPYNGDRRFHEVPRLATVLERSGLPTTLGADKNGVSAARTPSGAYFDHNPYEDINHFDDIDQQILWTDSLTGPFIADRRASERLLRRKEAGWHDPAARSGGAWEPTTGHHPDDRHPPRRLDQFLVTAAFARPGVFVDYTVHSDPVLGDLFDHYPVSYTFETSALGDRAALQT